MGLIAPSNRGFVGGLTTLRFDQAVSELQLTLNGTTYHTVEGDAGPADTFTVDLSTVDQSLHRTPGVVETGRFLGKAQKALVGCGSPGSLTLRTLDRPSRAG